MFPQLTLITLIILLSILLLSLLISTIVLTVGLSVYTARKQRQFEHNKTSVREELFEGLSEPSPDWDPWVERLNSDQRAVVCQLLKDYLEVLSGSDQRKLQKLGEVLGINDRALRMMKRGNRHEQSQALRWLRLLGHPLEESVLLERCSGDKQLEARAAHLLLAGEFSDITATGTELLLSDGRPLTIHGMDALFQLYKHNPDQLLKYVEENFESWDPTLINQVLRVLNECSSVGDDVSLQWLFGLLDHGSSDVRASLVTVLAKYAWRDDVREAIGIEQLLQDPSPKVRRETFHFLDSIGDNPALELLQTAIMSEPDQRTQIEGVRILYSHRDEMNISPGVEMKKSWKWVAANASVET